MTRPIRSLLVLVIVGVASGDLIVNVRNGGGESYKQEIRANLTLETVKLSFESNDGSRTLMVIDFRNEIQLVHYTTLGNQEENELAAPPSNPIDENDEKRRWSSKKSRLQDGTLNTPSVYKSYCFVTKFKPNEFIPVDAMAKLRQKNPWSLRIPERQEPPQNISFDILLDATASDWISPTIREHCVGDSSFETTTYAIKMEISEKAVNPEDYLRSVRDITVVDDKACDGGDVGRRGSPCVCSDTVCVGWYPCALKFCRTRSSGNGTSSLGVVVQGSSSTGAPGDSNFKTYRCGIHTCRICRSYFFGVRSVAECV